MKRLKTNWVAAGALLAAALVSGCYVDTHKDGDGERVKVATPFGGVQVKTDNAAVTAGIGLAIYPAAEPAKKDANDKDNGSADVNISFAGINIRVKALSYRSQDSQDKVIAFYRKELGKYGTVIQCVNGQPVGQPTRTQEGLSCADEANRAASDISGKMELKAGSPQHQHLVAIDPEGGGTKFALVALDLPIRLSMGDRHGDEKDKN